uniref:Endonuclease/exonuclease/phosphatase domain-containing protein n=1 Tax=Caenorhabditis japonica TaxID=281687 RepID=A0A8R1EVJ3_CAEJA
MRKCRSEASTTTPVDEILPPQTKFEAALLTATPSTQDFEPLATYAGPAWHQLMSETQKTTKLERQYVGGPQTTKTPQNEDAAAERRADTGKPRKPPLGCLEDRGDEWRRMRGDTKAVQKKNHTSFVKSYLSNHGTHPILGRQPPPLNEEESTLPRNTRVEHARLRAERSLVLEKYKAKLENRPVESCIKCNDDPLAMSKLWKDPVAAARALGLAVTPFDPGGDADPLPLSGSKRWLRSATPPSPQHTTKGSVKPAKTKILSWNVNGWSKIRNELATIIAKDKPDIVCLQETKLDKTNL